MPFSNLGLRQKINKALDENAYKNPTLIQNKVKNYIAYLQEKSYLFSSYSKKSIFFFSLHDCTIVIEKGN